MTLRSLARRAKRRLIESRLPRTIEFTDFNPQGVRFSVTRIAEYYRVTRHGDETEYTAAMLKALKPDDVLYDIGANIGMVALHAAAICRTYAFEPDPEFADRLAASSDLNPTNEVHLHRAAIGEADGQMTLFTDGVGWKSPSLIRQRDESRAVSVQVRSLDSLAAEGELPLPTVVKLDIEGAEILALRGGRGLLNDPERGPRALFIEVHDAFLPAFGSSGDEVMALLRNSGFQRTSYASIRGAERHFILER